MPSLCLSQDPVADELLSKDPLALVIGMILDQQIPLERAFSAPAQLAKRLGGSLDVYKIAAADPEYLIKVFSEKPALHRFPAAMAKRVQEFCILVVEQFEGDVSKIWNDAKDGKGLLESVKSLPGFGDQKARIFVALIGKQLKIQPKGWRAAAAPFGENNTFLSIADIVDEQSLAKVRAYKQSMKAAAKTDK